MQPPFIIELSDLGEDGRAYEGSVPAEALDVGGDPAIQPRNPLGYKLFAELVDDELILRGRVETSVDLQCSRCAEFFSTTIEDSSFLRAFEIAPGTETVDVTPDLREAILLHLPAFPLCRADCAGLCPYCGVNRGAGACDCRAPEVDKRWSELDSLNLESAENEE